MPKLLPLRAYSFSQQRLWNDLTLIRCGGHYPGGTVLHWPASAAGRGALLTGDTLMVASDRRYVSFMYSFPNYIPLGAAAVNHIVATVAPWPFDRIYGAWWDRGVADDEQAAVARDLSRVCRRLALYDR